MGVELANFLSNEETTYIFSDCIGGERCFDVNMKWDEIYNPELWEIIKQFESKDNENKKQ